MTAPDKALVSEAAERAIRHDERKRIIARGCIHTRKAHESADYDRPDVSAWQHDQNEYFDPTICEIVSEYAAWRDKQATPTPVEEPEKGAAGNDAGLASAVGYAGAVLDAHADKLPVPSHARSLASRCREASDVLAALVATNAGQVEAAADIPNALYSIRHHLGVMWAGDTREGLEAALYDAQSVVVAITDRIAALEANGDAS